MICVLIIAHVAVITGYISLAVSKPEPPETESEVVIYPSPEPESPLSNEPVKVIVSGESVDYGDNLLVLDDTGQPFGSIRPVLTKLGEKAPTWINDETLTIAYKNVAVTLTIGDRIMRRSTAGTEQDSMELEKAPYKIEGITVLPILDVVKALGLGVHWDDATNTLTITTPSSSMIGEEPSTNGNEQSFNRQSGRNAASPTATPKPTAAPKQQENVPTPPSVPDATPTSEPSSRPSSSPAQESLSGDEGSGENKNMTEGDNGGNT